MSRRDAIYEDRYACRNEPYEVCDAMCVSVGDCVCRHQVCQLGHLIDEIAKSLTVSAALSNGAGDPATAAELTRPVRCARRYTLQKPTCVLG